jgi:uncharacterized protein (DUF58 family)
MVLSDRIVHPNERENHLRRVRNPAPVGWGLRRNGLPALGIFMTPNSPRAANPGIRRQDSAQSRFPEPVLPDLFHSLRSSIHFRITGGGILYIFAVLLVGFAAFRTGNNLLFLVFSALLAILLVSGFLSRLMLSGLELELLLPEHVWARTAAPARIRLRNLKRFTPSFSLELSGQPGAANSPPILTAPVYFPIIPGRTTVEASIEVTFPRRGRHRENVFLIATRFPFGFLRKTTTLALQRETIVYPALEPFPGAANLLAETASGEMEMPVRGPGKDFYRIRPYEPGDSARHIDWKISAHTGVHHIREFSRDEQAVVEVLLDRRTNAGESRLFESAVERCAFLISHLGAGDTKVFMRAQGFTYAAAEEDEFYVILRYLALVDPLIAVTSAVESESDFSASGVRVVFTSRPEEFRESGWSGACVAGADE